LVVAVVTPPANVPLAPDDGAAYITVTPLTGFWKLSTTVTTNGANVVLIAAFCGVPIVAVIVAGAPTVFVKLKLAVAVVPVVEAVTV
jgi:hypothetical protein